MQIAVDSDSVYWLYVGCGTCLKTESGGVLAKAPKGGGAAKVLIQGDFANPTFEYPHSLVVDATHVWVGASYGLYRVPKDGGAAERYLDGVNVNYVAQDAAHVYVSSTVGAWSLQRIPKAGGAPEPMTKQIVAGGPIAVDDDYVFLASENGSNIQRVSKSPPFAVDKLIAGAGGRSIGVDATHVYWNSAARVNKVPKAGGMGVTIGVITPPGVPAASRPNGLDCCLVQDASSVYFAGFNANTAKQPNSLSIYRLAKSDGARTEVASGVSFTAPLAFTVEGSTIYWLDSNFDVMRAGL